jgi:hypothetical protein
LKESLIIFLVGVIVNCGYFALKGKKTILRMLVVLIGFLLLFNLRGIVAAILLASILPFIWNHFYTKWRSATAYLIMIFVLASFIVESENIWQKSVSHYIVERKQAYIDQAILDNSESLFTDFIPKAQILNIASELPMAFVNVLFRPFPNQIHNPQALMALIENALLVGFIVLAFYFRKNLVINQNFLFFLLFFSLGYFLIIGLTIPVSGAISRYRVLPLLYLEVALLLILDPKKIKFLSKS